MSHTCDMDEWGQCPCSANYGKPPRTPRQVAAYKRHLEYRRETEHYLLDVEPMIGRLRRLLAK